jgi:hypothetical protein
MVSGWHAVCKSRDSLTLEHGIALCGGITGFLLLWLTPGAWISFGLPLRAIPFWARLLTGAALSPVVVCGQFFLVRWMGVPFHYAAAALVAVNLPALVLVFRNIPAWRWGNRTAWLIALSVLVPCLILMFRPFFSEGLRIYSPHAWVYSDPVYQFARGDLLLEDPTLAGIRMSYPLWPALAFQALLSFLLDSPPASSWVWTNLACLLVTCGFAVGITKELGGGRLAQAVSGVWLMLGVNPVGYLLTVGLPGMAGRHLFGDLRYAPWVRKFHLFSTMPLSMALIAALLYLLLVMRLPDTPLLITMGLLLAGTGLLYPLLFPPACAVFGAKMLVLFLEQRKTPAAALRRLFPLGLVLMLTLAACYGEVKFIQQARQIGPAFVLSAASAFARKAVVSLIAMSVLLLGLAAVFRQCRARQPGATAFLLTGALACAFLHSLLYILYWDNEYKFVYISAMCLAPFPALATEHIWKRLTPARAAAPLLAAAVLLVFPYVHRYYLAPEPDPSPGPVDTSSFYLRLKPQEAWSAICNAARTMTPANAILVTQSDALYFPALTSRNLYVPAADQFYPGVTLNADVLAGEIRGNGRAILGRRRQVLNRLFAGSSASEREASLQTLLSLGKPLAFLIEPRHQDLLTWLRNSGHGTELYQHDGVSLWLILQTHPKPLSGGEPKS